MTDAIEKRPSGRALLCLYYTQQVLPALAALLQHRQCRGVSTEMPAALLVWSRPDIGDAAIQRRHDAFRVLLQSFSWIELHCPGRDEICRYLSPNAKVESKAAYLRDKFGENAFSEVFYSHDISADFMAQSAMQAFPLAERVCFGDAMGVVYRNDYFESMLYPLRWGMEVFRRPFAIVRRVSARLKRVWLLPPMKHRLDANTAVLILPCDPGGNFLPGKELIQVTDVCLRQALRAIIDATRLSGLREGQSTHQNSNPGSALMLLGNYSDSRLCGVEQEIALYMDIVRAHVPAGGAVILKPHPSAQRDIAEKLANALSGEYRATLTAEDADEIPIEAMPDLFQGRTILSFSYASVSLTYLYSAKVLHVMHIALIQKYFYPEVQEWMQVSNDLYMDQLAIAGNIRAQAGGAVWQR